jgi:hypothetical protein
MTWSEEFYQHAPTAIYRTLVHQASSYSILRLTSSQLFIPVHNGMLSVAAIRASNPDRSPPSRSTIRTHPKLHPIFLVLLVLLVLLALL